MYELRKPAAGLSRFIEHYWFVTSTASEPVDLRVDVFVDGRADLIINLGAPYERQIIGGATREIASSNLDAQRLSPIRIVQRGLVRTSGVRFHLGGLGAFVRIPLREITDATVAPAQAFGDDARALEDAIRATPDIDVQAARFDAFFSARLEVDPAYECFARALRLSIESEGNANMDQLGDEARVSKRQLERLFARYLGFPAKTLGRILRFQHTLRALMRDPGCALADIAAAAGYFDQAHFIKDFRRMTGGVPRGYRGYFPPEGPAHFAPNVVVFLQDAEKRPG